MNQIIHVITTICRGGAENQLLTLVTEQLSLGHKVSIIYLKGEPELETEFKKIGADVIGTIANYPAILQPFVLAKNVPGPNVILHSHLPRAELISTLTPRRFSLFTSRHNAEKFFPMAPKLISNLLSRLVEFRARKVIAISEAVKIYLIQSGEINNVEKLEVVHYGYNILNRRTSCNNDSSTVKKLGTVSRLVPQKNLTTMIKAFSLYKEIEPNATLSILGGGDLENELREYSEYCNVRDSVEFLGRSSKINDFLLSLDVFLLTSNYEGFGLVLLEAMDAQIPILASNNSAIPEVLGKTFPGLCETGNYDSFARKLEKLNNLEFKKQILEAQETRLLQFDARKMSVAIDAIYAEAIV